MPRDFDRTLTPEGQAQAIKIGQMARAAGHLPVKIISSTAARAQATARGFCEGAGLDASDILLLDELYETHAGTYQLVLAEHGLSVAEVMLVGHNPTISDAVEYFTDKDIGSLPLAGLVRIGFPLDSWQEVSRHSGNFLGIEAPDFSAKH